MIDEADARSRLLAHYEREVRNLEEQVGLLAGELAVTRDPRAKRGIQVRIAAHRIEITTFNWIIARARETIGRP